MSEIRIYPIGNEEAEKAEPFLLQEAVDMLKKGLPLTAFVAVLDGEAVGALAGAVDGHIFEIWSLYVDPAHRRKGAGRSLIRAVEKLLEDASEVAGIPIRAKYTSVNEDNRALRPFFLKLGFLEEPIPHPMYYVGYLEDLKPSEKLSSRGFANISDVITFSEAGDRLLKTATNISISQGFPMPEGGLLSEAVNRELSFCIVRDGKISAYVTAEDVEDDLIEVSALWSGLDNPVELLSMLIYLINALKKNYPPETKIAMLAANERTDKLVDYVFRYVEPCSYRLVKISNG